MFRLRGFQEFSLGPGPEKEDHAWSSTQAGGWTWFSTASGNAGASGGLSKYMSLPLLHGLILHPTLECLRKGWKSIERLIASDVPARTVALEPDTPAWFQHDDSGCFSTNCMWCDELGTHDHIFWRCPHSPLLGSRPAVPVDGLCRRFGWQSQGTSTLEYIHVSFGTTGGAEPTNVLVVVLAFVSAPMMVSWL